jgi:DNA-binding CsgD family transcriptional regulator
MSLHQHSPAELKELFEAQRRGKPHLVYRGASSEQLIFELGSRPRLTVGRGPGADLSFDWDPDVSRLHAELEYIGECWTVIDDGLSRNGTFVNGERLNGRRRLRDGDRARFGRTVVLFRARPAQAAKTTLAGGDLAIAAKLTDAQRRVLIALARPCARGSALAAPASNQQIADELVLSIPGVKTHLRTLFEKFGVEDLPQHQKRARLVALAFQSGEITDADLVG